MDKVSEIGLKCGKVLLIQDPTMQRRSLASFQKEWSSAQTAFYNWSPFIPKLVLDSNRSVKFAPTLEVPWMLERYIRLIMGEIPRLRNDENGYGPNGTGFIGTVDIPPSILDAYNHIYETLPDFLVERPRKWSDKPLKNSGCNL